MSAFDGRWKVRREKGLLLPFGIRKFITGDHGWTLLGPVPVAPFQIKGTQLLYKLWPIRDELHQRDGEWIGTGYIFGKKFCEFRLVPRGPEAAGQSRVTARKITSRLPTSRREATGSSAR